MLLPRVWMNDLWDDDLQKDFGITRNNELMKTDIVEKDDHYELAMNLPGFNKDDVKITLKDGYLTVAANSTKENKENNEEGKLIRCERYTGSCSRSFYVGDNLTHEDIKAKFENGVLNINVPKEKEKAVEEEKFISIE